MKKNSPSAWRLPLLLTALIGSQAQALTETEINLDVRHSVSGFSDFDREKYMVMHSSLSENDWDGNEDLLTYLMEDLDVYFGRNNGEMNWRTSQTTEDASRSGFADPTSVAAQALASKNAYALNETARHKYDARNEVMFGGQLSGFWPGMHNGSGGWSFANGEAVGEWMGHFVNNAFRSAEQGPSLGMQAPRYVEILNEPLYHLVDVEGEDPLEAFEFHRDAAEAFHLTHTGDTQIGGYVTAFPFFDERNFERWNERMKLFIDTAGEQMDYFAIHLYDFNYLSSARGPATFKGGRIEATLDMMEQYEQLTLGEVKPFLISEFGGRDHQTEALATANGWSSINDWQSMKAFSPMTLQFLERPHLMLKSIPFMLANAHWFADAGGQGRGYPWRLMIHEDERIEGGSADYVFSDLVKFYELWANVSGTRVDTRSNDPDVLIDAYVDGATAYVILSNLNTTAEKVSFNLFGEQDVSLDSVLVKHLYLNGVAAELSENTLAQALASFTLAPEATAILQYNFDADVAVNKSSVEEKYYAETYQQGISAGEANTFSISGVSVPSYGEAVLRLSFGRAHGLSTLPVVSINGNELQVSADFAGDMQEYRNQFFSVLEIPVAIDQLSATNTVAVTFSDTGGFVTTSTLEVYEFSEDIRDKGTAVTGVEVSHDDVTLGIGEDFSLVATAVPFFADNDLGVTYSSNDERIARVDRLSGVISAVSAGVTTIVAMSNVGGFQAQTNLTVESPVEAFIRFDDSSQYDGADIEVGSTFHVVVNVDAGTAETVVAGTLNGVELRLRHLGEGYAVAGDDLFMSSDASLIGERSGNLVFSVTIPDDATLSADLASGEFYWLWLRFTSSDGEVHQATAFPNLVAAALTPSPQPSPEPSVQVSAIPTPQPSPEPSVQVSVVPTPQPSPEASVGVPTEPEPASSSESKTSSGGGVFDPILWLLTVLASFLTLSRRTSAREK
ncbi:Ig-like domain-containing protein [Agaribacterium sp. ZY112]|uniref:Ig-like domain-containing protein n=1 Tax=Agaribacterium sp. ZY112 TaxID=3233574 RepID=UPI003524869F